jgi:hypothetical protein
MATIPFPRTRHEPKHDKVCQESLSGQLIKAQNFVEFRFLTTMVNPLQEQHTCNSFLVLMLPSKFSFLFITLSVLTETYLFGAYLH